MQDIGTERDTTGLRTAIKDGLSDLQKSEKSLKTQIDQYPSLISESMD